MALLSRFSAGDEDRTLRPGRARPGCPYRGGQCREGLAGAARRRHQRRTAATALWAPAPVLCMQLLAAAGGGEKEERGNRLRFRHTNVEKAEGQVPLWSSKPKRVKDASLGVIGNALLSAFKPMQAMHAYARKRYAENGRRGTSRGLSFKISQAHLCVQTIE